MVHVCSLLRPTRKNSISRCIVSWFSAMTKLVFPVLIVLVAVTPWLMQLLCTSERTSREFLAAGMTGLVFYFFAMAFFFCKSSCNLQNASHLTILAVNALYPTLFWLNGLIPKPPYHFCCEHISHMRLDHFGGLFLSRRQPSLLWELPTHPFICVSVLSLAYLKECANQTYSCL